MQSPMIVVKRQAVRGCERSARRVRPWDPGCRRLGPRAAHRPAPVSARRTRGRLSSEQSCSIVESSSTALLVLPVISRALSEAVYLSLIHSIVSDIIPSSSAVGAVSWSTANYIYSRVSKLLLATIWYMATMNALSVKCEVREVRTMMR